jgi:hypothetical protein
MSAAVPHVCWTSECVWTTSRALDRPLLGGRICRGLFTRNFRSFYSSASVWRNNEISNETHIKRGEKQTSIFFNEQTKRQQLTHNFCLDKIRISLIIIRVLHIFLSWTNRRNRWNIIQKWTHWTVWMTSKKANTRDGGGEEGGGEWGLHLKLWNKKKGIKRMWPHHKYIGPIWEKGQLSPPGVRTHHTSPFVIHKCHGYKQLQRRFQHHKAGPINPMLLHVPHHFHVFIFP